MGIMTKSNPAFVASSVLHERPCIRFNDGTIVTGPPEVVCSIWNSLTGATTERGLNMALNGLRFNYNLTDKATMCSFYDGITVLSQHPIAL